MPVSSGGEGAACSCPVIPLLLLQRALACKAAVTTCCCPNIIHFATSPLCWMITCCRRLNRISCPVFCAARCEEAEPLTPPTQTGEHTEELLSEVGGICLLY